jgi:hypothetical protein
MRFFAVAVFAGKTCSRCRSNRLIPAYIPDDEHSETEVTLAFIGQKLE